MEDSANFHAHTMLLNGFGGFNGNSVISLDDYMRQSGLKYADENDLASGIE